MRPSWPSHEGATVGDGAVARGPHARERGWLTALMATKGGGFDRSPAGGEIQRRFSAAGLVLRRGGGGEARVGAGDHGSGVNLACGAYGGRSAARWRVPAAVMPPVRFPATIEGEKWRPVTVRVWRSFEHSLIGQRIARDGEGSSPER